MAVDGCAPVLSHPDSVDEGFDRWLEPAVMDFIREIMKQSPVQSSVQAGRASRVSGT
jgi:hypothetical protein